MLGFFGFLRAGKFTVPSVTSFNPETHLAVSNVAVVNPSLLRVHIKCSKTDPFRWGVHIFLGKTGNRLCPVKAMVDYLELRGGNPGPLLRFQDGSPLTRARLVSSLRTVLAQAHIPVDEATFSGHSFHIGVATTAARKGVEDSTIRMLGHWESGAYQRTPHDQLARVSVTLSSTSEGDQHLAAQAESA